MTLRDFNLVFLAKNMYFYAFLAKNNFVVK